MGDAEWYVRCDCGWEARALRDELVERIRQHAREVHDMQITAEQALAQARPA